MKNITFKVWLREQLRVRGCSNKDFAMALGVASNTVCRWNTEKNLPNAPMIYRIAETLRALDGEEPACFQELTTGALWACMVSSNWTYWAPKQL
jgi:transcriptional regulator with XRE-family HTH domain